MSERRGKRGKFKGFERLEKENFNAITFILTLLEILVKPK